MKKTTNYLFIVLICILTFTFQSCSNTNQLPPPNIVWVTSEDNSVHYMKIYDEGGVSTPNIESLAAHGLVFNNAFSNAAVCSAARSTIISGCYGPKMASHYHRKQKEVPMPDGLNMFPSYLRKAGYYTTNNNKEDYNIIKSEGTWDESSKKAHWRNRAEEQPFFHVQNFGVCHESSLHFNETKMKKNPTNFNVEDVKVQPNHPNTDLFKYTNAYYRDKIAVMDSQIGKVLNQLKEDNLMDDTFIFYYGDHGGVLPGSKGYLLETGLHVPMIIYVPKNYRHLVDFKEGSRVDGFVEFVDLAPTVLQLAGIELPKGLDGEPFLGEGINAEQVNTDEFTYSYADRFDEKSDMVRAIRKGKYKYVRNYQPFYYNGLMNNYRYKQLAYKEWLDLYKKGELNEVQSLFFEPRKPEQLFNIEEDRFETTDLAGDPEYAAVLKEMRALLNKQEESMPDLSFYPEYYLKENAFDNPIKFGQKNKENILNYKAIADLQILPFNEVKETLAIKLTSSDSWERYWALTVCSSFGEEAKSFAKTIKNIAKNDEVLANKVKAAEFLGITKLGNPVPVMTKAIYSTNDETEALLILNSIVFMRDIHHNYDFNIDMNKINQDVLKGKEAKQRFAYLLK
ncbi:sulfatase [Labilibacter sediminis]|nr:sulfatase [Labilibacter sediminis]